MSKYRRPYRELVTWLHGLKGVQRYAVWGFSGFLYGFLYGVLFIAIVGRMGSGSTPMPRPWYVYPSYLIMGTIVGLLRARFVKAKPAPPVTRYTRRR